MEKFSKNLNDEQLLDLIQKNDDRTAFTELYNRYWDKIFILAANALQSPEEAEECVQDIFCSLWNRRKELRLKYSLYTYLAVAVKYRIINILDKAFRQKQRAAKMVVEDSFAASAETLLLEKELFARLEKAVNLLPEKCRLVFKMSREQGKTHKQIAEELQISEKTVNNHLTKALKDLGNNLNNSAGGLILCFFLR